MADDVVADRLGTKVLAQLPGGLKNGQFTQRMLGIAGPRYPKWPCIAQLLDQQAAFGSFIELGIAALQLGSRQQFGHHQLMLVRALAQVDRGQMKAKDLDRPDQRAQPLRRQGGAVVRMQRGFYGAQIGQKIGRTGIGVLGRHRVARRVAAGQRLE